MALGVYAWKMHSAAMSRECSRVGSTLRMAIDDFAAGERDDISSPGVGQIVELRGYPLMCPLTDSPLVWTVDSEELMRVMQDADTAPPAVIAQSKETDLVGRRCYVLSKATDSSLLLR